MSEQLSRCPHCGSTQAEVSKWTNSLDERSLYFVICGKCAARTNFYKTREEAITAWNHRPIEDVLRGELEQARAEIAEMKARTCENCGIRFMFDRSSGYYSCDHWRGYVLPDGYCHMWEPRKEQL